MRIQTFHRPRPLDDEGAVLAAVAVCGLAGVVVATALAVEPLLALFHPLLPYLH